MPIATETVSAADGRPIPVLTWPAPAPGAVLQLAHGMGEHALRYDRLGQALAARGITMVANAHRGHGPDAERETTRGDFGAGGFDALVSAATDLLMAPGGAQRKLEDYAGSGPTRTPFDWLSRDAAEVDKYIADPLCGFSLTKPSRATMVEACARTAVPGAFSRLPARLPVYLMTGDQDPVNNRLAWFHPLVERLRDAGLHDLTVRIYPGARHELLNETNRAEVTADLLAWLDQVLA